MRTNQNRINGQPLQFGNLEQITFVKEAAAKLSGEKPVCEAEWEPVQYPGKTNETRKPLTYYCAWKDCDALQCFIPCPRCHRLHKQVVGYDPHDICQTEQLAAVDEADITCWNCGLEMFIAQDGSRNVFVKQNSEQ